MSSRARARSHSPSLSLCQSLSVPLFSLPPSLLLLPILTLFLHPPLWCARALGAYSLALSLPLDYFLVPSLPQSLALSFARSAPLPWLSLSLSLSRTLFLVLAHSLAPSLSLYIDVQVWFVWLVLVGFVKQMGLVVRDRLEFVTLAIRTKPIDLAKLGIVFMYTYAYTYVYARVYVSVCTYIHM